MSYLWTRNKGEKLKASCQQWLRKHRADKAFRKVRTFSKLTAGGQVIAPKCPTIF